MFLQPTHRVFINVLTDVVVILFAANDMVMIRALPNIKSDFLIGEAFEPCDYTWHNLCLWFMRY